MSLSIREAMHRCKMKVVHPARRRNRVMRWVDPETGDHHEETTGTPNKREAMQVAADRARRRL